MASNGTSASPFIVRLVSRLVCSARGQPRRGHVRTDRCGKLNLTLNCAEHRSH